MADPKGISPPTPHAETGAASPSPRVATRQKDDDPENTTSLVDVNTAYLKKIGAIVPPKLDNTQVKHGHYDGTIPQSLVDGAQKAIKEFKLPATHRGGGTDAPLSPAEVFPSYAPDMNPNRLQFNIPGYRGKWALSVDRQFIGKGSGQVSAERWADVAKRLGQSVPSASPAAPQ